MEISISHDGYRFNIDIDSLKGENFEAHDEFYIYDDFNYETGEYDTVIPTGKTYDVLSDGSIRKIYMDNELLYEFTIDNEGNISNIKNGKGETYDFDLAFTRPIDNLSISSIRYSTASEPKEVKRIYTIQEANERTKELGGDKFIFKLRYK